MAEADAVLPVGKILTHWQGEVDAGRLDPDPSQTAVAEALDTVLADLTSAKPPRAGLFRRWRRKTSDAAVRGLYIWGTVGRGKTMLMDLFYEAAPARPKRRVHFNDFMADVHRRIAAARAKGSDTAVEDTADAIAGEARLLCFDEFAVTDIADAMILARLFKHLFEDGITLVATSNVAPDDLYKDGLNRPLFVPFIAELKANVVVVRMGDGADHRLGRLDGEQVYFCLHDEGFDRLWGALTGSIRLAAIDVPVGSRAVTAPCSGGGFTRFTFAELVEQPLGASDFAAIAGGFHTIFLSDVPIMRPDRRETTRRFITLIDVLYDAGARVVVSAAAEPNHLFDAGDGGGRYEGFAFDRTASRLYEMRSAEYLRQREHQLSS